MEKITRDQLIAKLSKMDGTSEVVDALLDWFETPQHESDWVTKDGVSGYIERVVTGDMPKTILSDWATYGDWCRSRVIGDVDLGSGFDAKSWVWAVLCYMVDARWCIQASAKSWPKDIRRADERYDSVAENPMLTCWGKLYRLVFMPDVRKEVPSMNMVMQSRYAKLFQFGRDTGSALWSIVMGEDVDVLQWCNCDGVGKCLRAYYDRVKQVYDTTVNAKVQRDEFRENEWVHEDKCQRMRDRYAKNKLEKNWIG